MNTFVQDTQSVGEVESVLFETLQQGTTDMLVTILNRGINTINYRFQTSSDGGSTWEDMGLPGTDVNNTLQSAQVRSFKVASNSSRSRLVGNASGGAILDFSLTRYFPRASGSSVPLINL
jgi:hypothetical protein